MLYMLANMLRTLYASSVALCTTLELALGASTS